MRWGRTTVVTAMLLAACEQEVATISQADADARLIGRPAGEICRCASDRRRRVLPESEALERFPYQRKLPSTKLAWERKEIAIFRDSRIAENALAISRFATVYVGDNQIRNEYGPSDPRAPVIRPLPEARASTRDRARCTARFSISGGRVVSVTYSRDGPGRATWQELCLPIIAACLTRWADQAQARQRRYKKCYHAKQTP